MSQLKVVVIGFGSQGKQLTVAARKAGMDVVAVCDPNRKVFEPPVKPEEVADWKVSFPDASLWYPPPNPYFDSICLYEEHPTPDIAIIATWTHEHQNEVLKAVLTGKARKIFLEEPISTSVRDASLMTKGCNNNGVPLLVHHTRGYWESHEQIGKLIREGKIGRLVSITITCGGCRLGMLGIHWIRCAMDWTNSELDTVSGKIGKITEIDPRGPQFRDDPGQILITFKNGVWAHIVQDEGMATSPYYLIQGTAGHIEGRQYRTPPHETWKIYSLEKIPSSPVNNYMGEETTCQWSYPITWEDQGVRALKELAEGTIRYSGEASTDTTSVLVAACVSRVPVQMPLPESFHDYHLQHP